MKLRIAAFAILPVCSALVALLTSTVSGGGGMNVANNSAVDRAPVAA
jgi:hypothetical protein